MRGKKKRGKIRESVGKHRKQGFSPSSSRWWRKWEPVGDAGQDGDDWGKMWGKFGKMWKKHGKMWGK